MLVTPPPVLPPEPPLPLLLLLELPLPQPGHEGDGGHADERSCRHGLETGTADAGCLRHLQLTASFWGFDYR